MAWWRQARFGMFIHWGLYAVPAGEWNGKRIGGIGEWIMHNAKIPVTDYANLAQKFNPVKFNAEEWVGIAKNAGMKYIVITSKHHDGFAMFHTRVSPYNIYDATPFKRDPLKELSEACKKQGIRLGFYYSQAQDWHHPGGAAAGGHWDKAQDGDMTEYIRNIAVPEVRELLTNYGPVAVLWWDTPMNMNKERADLLLPLLKLQPDIIWNNRLGAGYKGDSETPEQQIPATGYPGRDWETCMTMNDTWGYKSYDNNWKSTQTLLRNLADIASKGGNYLLNVGPTAEGLIPAPSVERLAEVGKWMQVNGDSIYGTSASPFRKLTWGRCTQKPSEGDGKPGRLFLHVFDWPTGGKLEVPGLKNKVLKAYLLADKDKAPLTAATEEGKVVVSVLASAPDKIDTVVVLEIEGAAEVDQATFAINQAADGSIALKAVDAAVHGEELKYESGGGKDNLGYWMNADDWASWAFDVTKPGEFTVEITFACDIGSEDSEYVVAVGDRKLTGKVKATGSWSTFEKVELGTMKIDKAGKCTLSVKATSKPNLAVMNLKSIVLKPVK
jgi:alpha-L-fucosidase